MHPLRKGKRKNQQHRIKMRVHRQCQCEPQPSHAPRPAAALCRRLPEPYRHAGAAKHNRVGAGLDQKLGDLGHLQRHKQGGQSKARRITTPQEAEHSKPKAQGNERERQAHEQFRVERAAAGRMGNQGGQRSGGVQAIGEEAPDIAGAGQRGDAIGHVLIVGKPGGLPTCPRPRAPEPPGSAERRIRCALRFRRAASVVLRFRIVRFRIARFSIARFSIDHGIRRPVHSWTYRQTVS